MKVQITLSLERLMRVMRLKSGRIADAMEVRRIRAAGSTAPSRTNAGKRPKPEKPG